MKAPVRINDRVVGSLALLSRGHRAADIEGSVELLRTIPDVLDVRTVFPGISEIANELLPHEALTMVLADEGVGSSSTRGGPTTSRGPPALGASTDLSSVKRETLAEVLRECRWNKSQAARRLGLSRKQLYIRMRRYDLKEPPAV